MLKILLVEDVPALQDQMVEHLTRQLPGYRISTAADREQALRRIDEERPGLVLLDLQLPPDTAHLTSHWREGRAVLRHVREHYPATRVIVLTSRGDKARDLLKREGADDFFTRDTWEEWARGELLLSIEECIGYLIGHSPAMRRLLEQLQAIPRGQPLFLLEGESGTGKRYLARVLHRISFHAHLGWQEWDAAIAEPEALCRALLECPAGTGTAAPATATFVIAGVEALAPEAQQRLAAVLESLCGARHAAGPAFSSPRIVLTATGCWRELHRAGRIAPELYALFAPEWGPMGAPIRLPPLRERAEDLPELATHLCRRHGRLQDKTVTGLHPRAVSSCSPRRSLPRLPSARDPAVGEPGRPSSLPPPSQERSSPGGSTAGCGRRALQLPSRPSAAVAVRAGQCAGSGRPICSTIWCAPSRRRRAACTRSRTCWCCCPPASRRASAAATRCARCSPRATPGPPPAR